MNSTSDHLDPAMIQRQVDRMLESDHFDASPRNKMFLDYVVRETLAGRGDRIKAYNIATSVLGRSSDFDPQTDSIVRIEASRLRRSLEHYYLASGDDDVVKITLPLGTYVPAFEVHEHQEPEVTPTTTLTTTPQKCATKAGPRIFVSMFEQDGDHSEFPNFTHSLMRQIIVGLTRFSGINVFGSDTTSSFGSEIDRTRIHTDLGADFLLVGATTLGTDCFTVKAILVDAATGQYLWAETYERGMRPNDLAATRDKVADSVVRALAQPFGAVFSKTHDIDGPVPEHLASYNCVARYHQYCKSFDSDIFAPLIVDLERTVAQDPSYSEACACLSQAYTNSVRFCHDVSAITPKPLERALELAHRSIELAPHSSFAYHALGLAYWYLGDAPGAIDALETGHKMNPNDTDIKADLGHRYGLLGKWGQAVPLLEQSYEYNPAQSGTYRIMLSLYYYINKRYDEALAAANKVGAPTLPYGYLLIAMAAVELERMSEARAAVQHILELDPKYGDRLVEDLISRNLVPEVIVAIVSGMQKAGLKIKTNRIALEAIT